MHSLSVPYIQMSKWNRYVKSFCLTYDLFCRSDGDGRTYHLEAKDRPTMMYWLQELQKKRRQHSKKRTALSQEQTDTTLAFKVRPCYYVPHSTL